MQKTRCASFSLTLVVLLGNWLIANVNARIDDKMMQISDDTAKFCAGPLPPLQTKRTSTGRVISYRLDAWSQYENPEEIANKREGDVNNLPSRKALTTKRNLLWPNGVVKYYVNAAIVNQPGRLALLEKGLSIIMSNTCIRFQRILDYRRIPMNSWVNISGHYQGCYCDIGRRDYGPTNMNLNVNQCFTEVGHIIHEMMHALGVYHEHMRPDRDNYITIIWENIQRQHAYNFNLTDVSEVMTYGFPYDYDSVMHYSMTAFSTNRADPTIIPKNTRVAIGQRSHMSHYDTQKLLIAYNCKALTIAGPRSLYNNNQFTRKHSLIQREKIVRVKSQPQNNKFVFKTEMQVPISNIYNSKSHEEENMSQDQSVDSSNFD